MDYVNLGRTGLKVSRICLGCMTYGAPGRRARRAAATPGRWTRRRASRSSARRSISASTSSTPPTSTRAAPARRSSGRFLKAQRRRESVVIATKVHGAMRDEPNGRGLSRKAILLELDESLRRLGTDYVDLYQIHRWDYETPIEETLEALHDVVKAGKVRYIGASSMYAWQFAKALYLADRHGWTRFVSMQNHYNLLYREEEREMMALCRAEGIGVIPWSPLARGRLARPWKPRAPSAPRPTSSAIDLYTRTEDEPTARSWTGWARSPPARGSRAQVALAWLLGQAGRHRADRRRHQAAPPRRRRRRALAAALRRGGRRPGGALRAAPGAGFQLKQRGPIGPVPGRGK